MGTSRGSALLVFFVVCCIASTVSATLEDGLPRPKNFPDAPTSTYGPTPELTSDGFPVVCEWYGFANALYNAGTGANCLTTLRNALTNVTVNPPSKMKPYVYYTLKRLVDPSNNQSFCFQGCFNLGASPPVDAAAPPPVLFDAPPVGSVSPTPLSFPGAPPPASIPPPLAVTPAGDVPVPTSDDAPVAPSSGPIAVPSTGVFLNPTSLLSCLVAAVALFANVV